MISIFIFAAQITFGGELQAIVYCSGTNEDDLGLCSISPEGTKHSCLNDRDHSLLNNHYSSPAWKPKSKELVVEYAKPDGDRILELIDGLGNKIREVNKSFNFMRPVWSPDGSHIYALKYGIGPQIGQWDSNGMNFKFVPIVGAPNNTNAPNSQGDFQMISFSPSGKSVALLNYGFKQIIVASVKEQQFVAQKELPTNFNYVAQSAWLDESHLLFVGRLNPGAANLWELNIGDGSTRLVEIPNLSLQDYFALSPDRKSVVVCATEKNQNLCWSLWEYLLGSPAAKRLTTRNLDSGPTWGD